jgi:hypothetical protein
MTEEVTRCASTAVGAIAVSSRVKTRRRRVIG